MDDSPPRDPAQGVHPTAEAEVKRVRAGLFALGMVDWVEGAHWDKKVFDGARDLIKIGNSGWTGYDLDVLHGMFHDAAPDDGEWTADDNEAKWQSAIDNVAGAGVPLSPFEALDDELVADADAGVEPRALRRGMDVSDLTRALRGIRKEIGRNALSGLFARDGAIVYTPRINEAGYVPITKDERNSDGPAQVRRVSGWQEFAGRVDHYYRVFKKVKQPEKDGGGIIEVPTLFPKPVAERVITAIDLLPNLRVLRSVTHTPSLLRDGAVLDAPGYHAGSGLMYLPIPGLVIPVVPTEPTPGEVKSAGELIMELVIDFPFVTTHDKANFLGALFTPLIRAMVPPPYQAVVITAPQRGSGKSLLAWIMREIHGGVFRSEFPRTEEEVRKVITSILFATTGPVVQIDNVTGVVKSGTLDGLLTTAKDGDRMLGKNTEQLALDNDRLWTFTGNNVRIGGDMQRRSVWVSIDANMEKPETRTEFVHTDLEGWVVSHRGDLLCALLTVVRGWVVAGQPVESATRTDQYGRWFQVLRGVLDWADLGETVGTFGHEDSMPEEADPEEEEWSSFLAAAHREFGDKVWTTRELLATVPSEDTLKWAASAAAYGAEAVAAVAVAVECAAAVVAGVHVDKCEACATGTTVSDCVDAVVSGEHPDECEQCSKYAADIVAVVPGVMPDELPGDIDEKRAKTLTGASKALGIWLGHRQKRRVGGFYAEKRGERTGTALWRVVKGE